MPRWTVEWVNRTVYTAAVEARNQKEAIEKALESAKVHVEFIPATFIDEFEVEQVDPRD